MRVPYALLIVMFGVVAHGAAYATSSPSPAVAQPAPTVVAGVNVPNAEDSQRFGFSMTASNVRLQMKVNGISVLSKLFLDNEAIDYTFNEWLHRGKNTVEIKMERFQKEAKYSVNYQLYYQRPSQVVANQRSVLAETPNNFSLPFEEALGVNTDTMVQLRLWLTDPVDLVDAEKFRIVDTINALRQRFADALVKGDTAFLATYDNPIHDEVERAYGRMITTEETVKKRRISYFQAIDKMVNASVDKGVDITADDLNFVQTSDKRFVRVSRKDGQPIVKINRGELNFTIRSALFGQIGGVWERLR